MFFIIFPNQLFYDTISELRKYEAVYILEEPLYFYDKIYRPYNYNKTKLVYMRSCMKSYYDYLQKYNINVSYINYDEVPNFYKKINNVYCFDPIDNELLKKYNKLEIILNILSDSPMFLAKSAWLDEYYKTKINNKNLHHSEFYKYIRKKLGLLENLKNYDDQNRKPIKDDINIKYDILNFYNKSTKKYYDEAIEYINNHNQFKNNIGDPLSVYMYPITHNDAIESLKQFLKHKLSSFGDYQDAIDKDRIVLFHSCLSCSLNIGLVTPEKVLKITLDFYYKNKDKIKINNLDGFIRQILGWREYTSFIYKYYYKDIIKSNYWNNKKKLNWNYWYGKESTGIDALDNEINKCIKYAYSHHIIRLMMFLNIFILLQVNPYEIKKWFQEVCAIDAYEWVMVSNIWAMGYFSSHFMKKPYLSTDNYIIKMSNYKKKPDKIWSLLYYNFLYKNKIKLVGGAAIYLRNLHYFENLTYVEKKNIIKTAEQYQKIVTI